MVRSAEQTARSAESVDSNDPGYCLQWCRERADIPAVYPDASTAWRHAVHRHKGDRHPPRGAMVYWVGGSSGYGHIAVAIGNDLVRSTDANGSGNVATRSLDWFERSWPSITFVGWADNVNDVIIPGVGEDDPMTEDDWKRLRTIVGDEVDRVWSDHMTVTAPGSGKDQSKAREQILRELWQKVTKAT